MSGYMESYDVPVENNFVNVYDVPVVENSMIPVTTEILKVRYTSQARAAFNKGDFANFAGKVFTVVGEVNPRRLGSIGWSCWQCLASNGPMTFEQYVAARPRGDRGNQLAYMLLHDQIKVVERN